MASLNELIREKEKILLDIEKYEKKIEKLKREFPIVCWRIEIKEKIGGCRGQKN